MDGLVLVFPPTGGMVNSDVVIGWVNDEGQAFLDVS